jgi:hypothetical protein
LLYVLHVAQQRVEEQRDEPVGDPAERDRSRPAVVVRNTMPTE